METQIDVIHPRLAGTRIGRALLHIAETGSPAAVTNARKILRGDFEPETFSLLHQSLIDSGHPMGKADVGGYDWPRVAAGLKTEDMVSQELDSMMHEDAVQHERNGDMWFGHYHNNSMDFRRPDERNHEARMRAMAINFLREHSRSIMSGRKDGRIQAEFALLRDGIHKTSRLFGYKAPSDDEIKQAMLRIDQHNQDESGDSEDDPQFGAINPNHPETPKQVRVSRYSRLSGPIGDEGFKVEAATNNPSDIEKFRKRLAEITGYSGRITNEHIHRLASAVPPNHEIGFAGGNAMVHPGGSEHYHSPMLAGYNGGSQSEVMIERDEHTGLPVLHNLTVHTDSLNKKVKGIELFKRQVEAARQLGIHKIVLQAAGNLRDNHINHYFNGYYTWPRFGFSAKIPAHHLVKLPDHESKHALEHVDHNGMIDIQDLFDHPDGPHEWELHGDGLDMEFLLHPESRNSKALEKYLAIKDTPEYRERRKREINHAIDQAWEDDRRRAFMSRAKLARIASGYLEEPSIGEQMHSLLIVAGRYSDAGKKLPKLLSNRIAETMSKLSEAHASHRKRRASGDWPTSEEVAAVHFRPSPRIRRTLHWMFG